MNQLLTQRMNKPATLVARLVGLVALAVMAPLGQIAWCQDQLPAPTPDSVQVLTQPNQDIKHWVGQPNPVSDLVVVVDFTRSMEAPCGREQRMAIAQWALYDLLDSVPDGIPTSVIVIQEAASTLQPLEPMTSLSKSHLRRVIMQYAPRGEGRLVSGVAEAWRMLKLKPAADPAVIVMTDGYDCDPYGAHSEVKNLHDLFGKRLRLQTLAITTEALAQERLATLAAVADGVASHATSHQQASSELQRMRAEFERIRQARIDHTVLIERELGECRVRIAELEKTIHDQGIAIHNLEKDLKEAREKLLAADKRIESLLHELHDSQKELKNARDEITTLKGNLDRLQEQYDTARIWYCATLAFLGLLTLALLFLLWSYISRLRISRFRNSESNRELEKLREQFATAQRELIDIKEVAQQRELALTEMRQKLADTERELQRVNCEYADAKQELAVALNDLKDKEVLLSGCQQKIADAERALQHLQSDFDRTHDELQRKIQELKDLQVCLARCQEHAHDVEKQLLLCQAERKSLEVKVDELLKELSCCRHKLEECQCRAAEQHRLLDAANRELADEKTARVRAQTELHTAQSSIKRLEDEARDDKLAIRDLQAELARQQKAYSDAHASAASNKSLAEQLNDRVEDLERDKARLEAELSGVKQSEAAASERALGATREMAANKKGCCCSCGSSPAVVYGPVVTSPTTPSTPQSTSSPSPVGGAPATAAGGPSAPAAAGGPSAPAATTAGPAGPTTAGPASSASGTSTGVGGAPGGIGGAEGTSGTSTGVAGAGTASNSATPTSTAQSPLSSPTPAIATPSVGTGAAAEGTSAADSDAEGGSATAIAS